MERTFGIIKPDAVEDRLVGNIISMIENSGLKITGMRMRRLHDYEAAWLYHSHEGKPHFRPLIEFMLSGPVVLLAIEGDDACARWRALMGATDSSKAEDGTIRFMYGSRKVIRRNCVHGSDGPFAAAEELMMFFPEAI